MRLRFWIYFIVSFLIGFFLTTLAHGQENRGVSWLLQMCSEKTDCSAISLSYKNATIINAGWLYLTSNRNRCKCAPQLLRDARQKRIRIDICNSTCFPERGRKCEAHECFANMNHITASAALINGDEKTFQRIDRAIALARHDILIANPPLEVAIKPCLECTLSRQARAVLNNYVEEKFADIAGIRFVDNPINDACMPGMLCERHGNNAIGQNGIIDSDGTDYDTIDQWNFWKENAQSFMVLAWKACDNGLKKGDGYSPPTTRTNYCSARRDGLDFDSATQPNAIEITSQLDQKDLAGCRKMLPVPDHVGGFILKLGENKTNAVWISPAEVSLHVFRTVEMRKNGAVIDRSIANSRNRYGSILLSDPRRRIYDFSHHPHSYPDNSVLFADGNCWILPKPRFRID